MGFFHIEGRAEIDVVFINPEVGDFSGYNGEEATFTQNGSFSLETRTQRPTYLEVSIFPEEGVIFEKSKNDASGPFHLSEGQSLTVLHPDDSSIGAELTLHNRRYLVAGEKYIIRLHPKLPIPWF